MSHTYITERVKDLGPTVICDVCNEDYTDRTESGGFLFGSYAYCPVCASSMLLRIKDHHEEHHIKARCPDGISFRDWVLQLRGGDNTVRIITADNGASSKQTPYAILCRTHGKVFLTESEYDRQMDAPDARWTCPHCGASASYEDL